MFNWFDYCKQLVLLTNFIYTITTLCHLFLSLLSLLSACYVTRCVQTYVKCARQAASDELFNACKMLHKLCASSCSKHSIPEDFTILWSVQNIDQ